MGSEEGEEVQVKDIGNIFSNIITENFPNLKKPMLMQVQKVSQTPKTQNQNRTALQHVILKM
jgi:hypothetical protein